MNILVRSPFSNDSVRFLVSSDNTLSPSRGMTIPLDHSKTLETPSPGFSSILCRASEAHIISFEITLASHLVAIIVLWAPVAPIDA